MAKDVGLLKTDRNSVLLLVEEAQLDPSEFQWQDVTAWDSTGPASGRGQRFSNMNTSMGVAAS